MSARTRRSPRKEAVSFASISILPMAKSRDIFVDQLLQRCSFFSGGFLGDLNGLLVEYDFALLGQSENKGADDRFNVRVVPPAP